MPWRNFLIALVLAGLGAGCNDSGMNNPLHARKDIPISKPDASPGDWATDTATAPSARGPESQLPPPATRADLEELPTALSSGPDQSQRPIDSPDLTATPAPATATAAAEEKPAAIRPIGKEVFSASVLQVNNQYLRVDEIVRSMSDQLKAISKSATEEKFRQRAAEALTDEIRRQVSECLVYTEANNRADDEQKKLIDAEVDHTLRSMITEFGGGSKIKLEQALIEQGTTLDTVLTNYRRRVVVQAYMHNKLLTAVRINRSLLWDYYSKHRDEFTEAPKVRMQTITVPFKAFLAGASGDPAPAEMASARKQARERIAQAAAELKGGKGFAEVAIAYSKDSKAADGGLWPAMPQGSFRDAKVESAAFSLEQGKASDIIEGQSAWCIVKAAEVIPGRTTSFEDAQGAIETKLRDQQEQKLTQEYFNKLLEGSTVVQYNKFLELAVERAVERFYKDR